MKNYFTDGWRNIKVALFNDRINFLFFSITVFLAVIDYVIWKLRLEELDFLVITLNGVYPIEFLAVILLINATLAIFSYDKEKEISYFLFGSSIFIVILIFILEIFYLFAIRNYV